MNNFVRVMKQEVVPVDQQLNIILQQQIAKNRIIMASLFKTVLFCGRNNIAFRGSRREDPSNENLKGNFQALLYFFLSRKWRQYYKNTLKQHHEMQLMYQKQFKTR